MLSMLCAFGESGWLRVAVPASAGWARVSATSTPSGAAARNQRRRRCVRVTGARILQAAPRWCGRDRRHSAGGSDVAGGEGGDAGRRLGAAGVAGVGAAPSLNAAPRPAMAPIALDAPLGSSISLLESPSATAGSASRYL